MAKDNSREISRNIREIDSKIDMLRVERAVLVRASSTRPQASRPSLVALARKERKRAPARG